MVGRRTYLVRLAVAAAAIAAASVSEAGHQGCRTCGTSGRGPGAWYHFTSGGGMYVPTARTTVASYSASPACSTCQPVRHTSHQTVVYNSAVVHPTTSYARPCSNCGPR